METETPEIGPYFSKVGPEIGPNADQLTALTRGRGPRRGNLEDLLKYWRPIMKKPGGFRRCVVILMDKPQFGGKPQRICAWLHHELTGKWPNEGKGKRGAGKGNRKRRGKLTRRVRSAARKAKSVDLSQPDYSGSSLRYAVSESRAYGGILVQPIAGRQNVVDMKAAIFRQYLDTPIAVEHDEFSVKRVGVFGSNSRFGQAAQAVGSSTLPGNVSVVRSPVRSGIYRALTPGGGSGRGRRLAGAGRRLLGRSGRGARNRFRCPPGFENGGTFTDRRFSTCGAQILGIPTFGPGSLIGGTGRALARLARNAELISSIGDLRSQRNPGVIIRNAQIPSTPKKVNVTARASGVNTILNAIGDTRWNVRVAKRDGVVLEPVAGLSFFANQTGDFDDVVDGSLVVRNADASFDTTEIIEAAQSLNAGFKDVYFAIPEVGVVRFGREGGELTPAERTSLTRTLPTRISRDADIDPTAGLRGFADDSGGKFVVEFGNLNEQGRFNVEQSDNQLLKVQGPGGMVRQVPQWVYETFLSRSAPRRAKDDPIFELVPEGKSVNPFFITAKAVQPDTLYKEYQADIAFKVDAYKDQAYLGGVNFKRVRPGGVPLRRALGGFASALAFFDPSISRYRCPPGFTGGGQLTNMRGTTCGRSLNTSTMLSLGNLQDARGKFARNRPGSGRLAGVVVDDIEEGSFRQSVFETQAAFDEVMDNFDKLSERLPPVDQLDRLTPVNAPQLTDDVRAALDNIGPDLLAALNQLKFVDGSEELDEPSWEALASRLQDVATIEAQRQAYLDFYGIRLRDARAEGRIEVIAERLVDIANNQRVATTVDEVTEEGVTALSAGERAEERIEALIDLNDQDGLWDVASMADYGELLDQLPMPETDAEERRLGLLEPRFREAMLEQVSKYKDKVDNDPDSLSLEEYSYLSYALSRIAEAEDFGPERSRLNRVADDVYDVTVQRRMRELGQLDRPSDERSEEALVYSIGASGWGSEERIEHIENYAARMMTRVYTQLETSEGGAYDAFAKNVAMESRLESELSRITEDLSKNYLLHEDYMTRLIDNLLAVADSEGLSLSEEDKALIGTVIRETRIHMQATFNLQRISQDAEFEAAHLDRLYMDFLNNDRDLERVASNMTLRQYEDSLVALQGVIDSLYGVDGAEQNLAALIAFKADLVGGRSRATANVAGKITFVTDDPDLLPGPDGVPVWQAARRERRKASTQAILTFGLSGLNQDEYDVVRPGETPHDTLYRLASEAKIEEWALKLLNASDVKDAKDRSKRTIVAAYDARTDDDRPVRVEIDNVSNADSVFISSYDELVLSSDLYVTVFDEDGNELLREKVSPAMSNVTRTLAFSPTGVHSVTHDYVVVNNRDRPQRYFSVYLPDGSTLQLDNRRRGISDVLNARYLAMAFAAGFKENHKLDVGWDGKYVWPKKGVRSVEEYKIRNINSAFRDLLTNYDGAQVAIARGQRLSRYQITALLIFDGDRNKRDRIASLLNYNDGLGESEVKDWMQYPEFIQALSAEKGSPHEGHVARLFGGGNITVTPPMAAALVNEVNSFIPEGSGSRIKSTDDVKDLTGYVDVDNIPNMGSYDMVSGVMDLSSADINEIGC